MRTFVFIFISISLISCQSKSNQERPNNQNKTKPIKSDSTEVPVVKEQIKLSASLLNTYYKKEMRFPQVQTMVKV